MSFLCKRILILAKPLGFGHTLFKNQDYPKQNLATATIHLRPSSNINTEANINFREHVYKFL